MTNPTPPAPSQAEASDEIDLMELVRNIWSGKYTIAICAILGALVAVFMVLKAERIFRADALLQIEKRAVSLAVPEAMQQLLGDDSGSAIETELEIMGSRLVLGEAVKELDLQIVVEIQPVPFVGLVPVRLGLPDPELEALRPYKWGNENISVIELETPEAWLVARPTDAGRNRMTLTITGAGTYSIRLPDGTVHDGRVAERLSVPAAGFSLLVGELEGPPGREFLLSRQTVETAIRRIKAKFSASASARGSSMIRLTFTDPVPDRAEQILDAISRAYVNQNLAQSAAEADKSLEFIDQQLPIAQAEVTEAQQKLNEYRQQEQSVDVDYETLNLLEQATKIEGELNALALEEEELKQRYTINHPKYQLLLENRRALETRLRDIQSQTATLPETQKEIFNLTRDLEVAQEAYVQLLNRAQELRVLRASTVGSARIVDAAYSDGLKISPRSSMMLAISTALGAIAGVGLVLFRRIRHRGVRGTKDLEDKGIPVFGTLNYVNEASRNRGSKGALPIYVLARPEDLFTEGMRSLRTSLHFGMIDAKINAVQITSARPGDGKSFVAVNLAVVLAQAGLKVCLIDGDLRRGYLCRYFGKSRDVPGMSDLLSHSKTLDEVLLPGPVDGLSIILTGRYPPNPSELLMRAEFETLLAELNKRFDFVLIDAAPVLAVTDPVVIGRYVGTTIMVVRHLESDLSEIEAARQILVSAGVKFAGAVLNQYRAEKVKHYGGAQHYSYRYKYTSEKGKA